MILHPWSQKKIYSRGYPGFYLHPLGCHQTPPLIPPSPPFPWEWEIRSSFRRKTTAALALRARIPLREPKKSKRKSHLSMHSLSIKLKLHVAKILSFWLIPFYIPSLSMSKPIAVDLLPAGKLLLQPVPDVQLIETFHL